MGECVNINMCLRESVCSVDVQCLFFPLPGLSPAESSKTRALKERLLREAELAM